MFKAELTQTIRYLVKHAVNIGSDGNEVFNMILYISDPLTQRLYHASYMSYR
jgi:hypothetical protein